MKKVTVVLLFLCAAALFPQVPAVNSGTAIYPTSGTIAVTSQIPTVTGGTCTNQAVTAISNSAVPTCTTLTSAYVTGLATTASPTFTGTVTVPKVTTTVNCSSNASPAVCTTASAGSIAIPTGITSVALTVNTSAVTANSQIFIVPDDTLGAKLSVTCNSTLATLVGGMAITARTAATSFEVTYNGTIATNPLCASFLIVN